MANEVTNALLVSNGGREALMIVQNMLDQPVYDAADFRNLMIEMPWSLIGTATANITIDAAPGAFAAASSETSGGISNSAYTTSNYSLTIAPYRKQYQMSDLFALTGGVVDPGTLLRKLQQGEGLTYTDLLNALYPSITQSVSDTGQDLTVDDIYTAMFTLNAANVEIGAGMELVADLSPVHFNNFQASLRGETGAVQFRDDTQQMLMAKSIGYKGMWNGIAFYQCDSKASANSAADAVSCLFTRGAFKYTMGDASALAQANMIAPGNVLLASRSLVLELSRDASNGLSTAVGHMYPAVAIANATKAVKLVFGIS
jgi:hypothetical protein